MSVAAAARLGAGCEEPAEEQALSPPTPQQPEELKHEQFNEHDVLPTRRRRCPRQSHRAAGVRTMGREAVVENVAGKLIAELFYRKC